MMLSLMMSIGAMAGEKDEYFTLNAGFLFNNTLNATFGYERELTYGNAVELFGEVATSGSVTLFAERYVMTSSGKATIGMAVCCISTV